MRARWGVVALLALAGCGGLLPYAQQAGQQATQGVVQTLASPDAGSVIDTAVAGAASAATQSAVEVVRAEVPVVGPEVTRQLVAVLDDTLRGEVASLREELVGQPLRADVDQLIDEATPRLAAAVTKSVQASVVPAEQAAIRDAGYFRDVAVGLAVSTALLLLALGFAVWEIRRHRAELRDLIARGGRS